MFAATTLPKAVGMMHFRLTRPVYWLCSLSHPYHSEAFTGRQMNERAERFLALLYASRPSKLESSPSEMPPPSTASPPTPARREFTSTVGRGKSIVRNEEPDTKLYRDEYVQVHYGDTLSFYQEWMTPNCIVSDGAYGVWPAPGFTDTELGVLMEPEVCYGATEVYEGVQA
jgi:hypothetical protein